MFIPETKTRRRKPRISLGTLASNADPAKKSAVKMFITERFDACHGGRNRSIDITRFQTCPLWRKMALPSSGFAARSGFLRYPVSSLGCAPSGPAPARSAEFDFGEEMGSSLK
jgi:hypothetical protein